MKIGNLDINKIYLGTNDNVKVYLGDTKLYPTSTPDYFAFKVAVGGDIIWSGSTSANTLSYSKDNGSTWTIADSGTTITVNSGDTILWKGTPTPITTSSKGIGMFSGATNVRYSVEGNAMSLLYGDNFQGQTSLEGSKSAFSKLFVSNQNITSAENLLLPATTLANSCYFGMFSGCTSLTTAPELRAITLVGGCYQNMFNGCTNLTTAPQLSATTLASNCYASMFRGCTSITTAPQLLVTTLASNCYTSMFRDCTSLTTAPELPATTLEVSCYQNMFDGCTSLTTAPELRATTLATNCYRSMFKGCSNLNSITCFATDISASDCTTDWVSGVAASGTFTKATRMNDWTSGTSGIPSGWTVKEPLDYFAFKVAVGGDIIWSGSTTDNSLSYSKDNGSTWTTVNSEDTITVTAGDTILWKGRPTPQSYYGIGRFSGDTDVRYSVEGNVMSLLYGDEFKGQTSLEDKSYALYGLFSGNKNVTSVENLSLLATTLADKCYQFMFKGCSNLTTAPSVLPATTLANSCYSCMFEDCSNLTTAPELLATTLASSCYNGMFHACRNLTTAPQLLATTLSNDCYDSMFAFCTSLTTAPELLATTLVGTCYYHMFFGCLSLSSIKCLATDISAVGCTTDWVSGVAASGTFTKAESMNDWTSGDDGIPDGWTVQEPTPSYFTFKVTVGGKIKWSGSTTDNSLSYSKDNGSTWTTANSSKTITVNSGDTILWKGTTTPQKNKGIGRFSGATNVRYSVEGNVMSLLYGDDFNGQTSLSGNDYALYCLFSGNTNVTSAENLSLPATTLANNCYQSMFQRCTSLTTAPSVLPATTLTDYCYQSMFSGCTSLTTAPELRATTLANSCYQNMFRDCTSLSTAPQLSATTLVQYCYNSMFQNCTSLTAAPELPATTLKTACYRSMFDGCTNLNSITCLATDISASSCTLYWLTDVAASGTFIKAASMNDWTSGDSGIPNGWTVQDAA